MLAKKLWHFFLFLLPLILIAIGIFLNSYAAFEWTQRGNSVSETIPSSPMTEADSITPNSARIPTEKSPTSSSKPSKTALTPNTSIKPSKFGHLPYPEGDSEKMIPIASYGVGKYQRFEELAPDAGLALMKMIYAARHDGIWLVPVSGFRSIANQEKLFERQIQRKGSVRAAAKVSSPPGYSEHHTGYAIDLTDGYLKDNDITLKFAETEAFKWLTRHASEFGFELSFPKQNPQGISYEPWHWRYVGSKEAKKLFSRARALIDSQP